MAVRKYKGENKSGDFCYKCGKPLNPERIIWLKLDRKTNRFTDKPDERGPEHDELFQFGPDCAKRELAIK